MAVFLAGIISLLNPKMGHRVVLVAAFAVVAYLSNALLWNIIQSSLLDKLSSKPKRK
jgi:hypothetical protein